MGGTATPADGAAPPVEDPYGDAGLVGDLPDRPQGLVDLPLRRGDPAVLVGVRVADHHLLGTAPEVHDPPVGLYGEERPEGRADGAQVVDRLEQRNESDPGRVMGQVDEPHLAGQDDRGQDVLDALCHRDDVALDDLVAIPVHDGPEHAEECEGTGVVGGAGGCEGSPALQFGGQQGGPLLGGRAGVVEVVGSEQGGQGIVVAVGVLPDVHGRNVEADHPQDPADPREDAVRQEAPAVVAQRLLDHRQVGVQVVGRAVAGTAGVAVGGGDETPPDGFAPDPVGLRPVDAVRYVLEGPAVRFDRLPQFVGHVVHPGADAQLVAHGDDLGDEDLQGVPALQPEHLVGGLGGDVGVAVAVATHPGSEADRDAVVGELLSDGAQGRLHLVQEFGYGVADCLAEVVEDRSGLVEWFRSNVAELVGLPDGLDDLFDPPVDAAQFGLGATAVEALLDEAADLGQLVQDGPSGGLGGMRREHRPEFGPTDQLGDVGRGDARVHEGLDRLLELVGGVRRAAVEVLDAVDLLGDVGEVEVHGERPDQEDGVGDVRVVE